MNPQVKRFRDCFERAQSIFPAPLARTRVRLDAAQTRERQRMSGRRLS